jgi:hypothetical protein
MNASAEWIQNPKTARLNFPRVGDEGNKSSILPEELNLFHLPCSE